MNLNRAMIIGNLTRDPEVRTTATGQNVANFGVATNHVWKDQAGMKQEKVEFHNIVAWGKLAEICGQYLGKGRKVYIEGRLQTREWEDKEGGKRKTTEIVAENMIMLDRGNGAGAGAEGAAAGATRRAVPSEAMPANAGGNDAEEIRVEDIPF
jgi:single-strand DNA-binding protein